MRPIAAVMAAFLLTQGGSAYAQGSCADVLRSVYDVTRYEERYAYSHSTYRFLCETTYASYSAARDAGFSLGIVLEALPINFGGHDRNTEWSEYQRSLCRATREQTSMSGDVALAMQTINAQIIDAWRSCVTSNAPGLYFYAETDDKAGANGTVTFRARWIGSGGDARIDIDRELRFTPPAGLNCHGDRFPVILDIAPRSVTCERTIDQAVHARFHTRRKGDREARVPDKFKPAAPPPPTVTTLCLSAGGFHRIPVAQGQPVRIRSSVQPQCSAGGWSCDRWATSSGPDGVINYRVGNAIDPGNNIGTLLGGFTTTAANSPDDVARAVKAAGPVRLGGAWDGRAPRSGFMYLIFNDVPGTWSDNAGAVWVEITLPLSFDVLTDGVQMLKSHTPKSQDRK